MPRFTRAFFVVVFGGFGLATFVGSVQQILAERVARGLVWMLIAAGLMVVSLLSTRVSGWKSEDRDEVLVWLRRLLDEERPTA